MSERLPEGEKDTARVVEIFSSVQGEGLLIGYRQIFLRLFGCNLRCDYCDTPDSLEGLGMCRIELPPGSWQFDLRPNPLSSGDLLEIVRQMNRTARHHSLSVTGGEPLLQAAFLQTFLPRVREEGLKIYLETNGLFPKLLARVVEQVDIIGMDIKIASSTGIGEDMISAHREFLRVGAKKELFVKVVVGSRTDEAEIYTAADLIAEVSPHIPLILQPVTPFGKVTEKPSPDRLLRLQAAALQRLEQVRIIPQMHKTMNVM